MQFSKFFQILYQNNKQPSVIFGRSLHQDRWICTKHVAMAVLAISSIPLQNENMLCSYYPFQNKKAQLLVKLSPSRGMVEANIEYSHVPCNPEISLSSCEFDNLQFSLFGKRRSYGNGNFVYSKRMHWGNQKSSLFPFLLKANITAITTDAVYTPPRRTVLSFTRNEYKLQKKEERNKFCPVARGLAQIQPLFAWAN